MKQQRYSRTMRDRLSLEPRKQGHPSGRVRKVLFRHSNHRHGVDMEHQKPGAAGAGFLVQRSRHVPELFRAESQLARRRLLLRPDQGDRHHVENLRANHLPSAQRHVPHPRGDLASVLDIRRRLLQGGRANRLSGPGRQSAQVTALRRTLLDFSANYADIQRGRVERNQADPEMSGSGSAVEQLPRSAGLCSTSNGRQRVLCWGGQRRYS